MPSGSIEIENKKKEINFKGYVTAPASGVYPGVLLLHQNYGMDANIRAYAEILAANNYTVFIPDLFWRDLPGCELNSNNDTDINKKGTTIILTTHYLEEAEQHCNNIAIIDKGSIVEDTSMKELLSRLSIQSFVLDLENEIQELPNLPIFDLKSQDSKTLTATLTKDDDLNSLFDKLSEHGIKVKYMRNEQNRLEELFIEMVKK